MAATENVSVGLVFGDDTATFTVGSDIHKLPKQMLIDRMDGKHDYMETLLDNMAVSLVIDGISKTDEAAIKSHIEGKTFKRVK